MVVLHYLLLSSIRKLCFSIKILFTVAVLLFCSQQKVVQNHHGHPVF